ncbi:hypothetical protein GXW78_09795 [Roseomonas terrae]|uniref:Uncharacterized protein n=1 Tax=Neoroseomonas terrae TaxID=424799 RepID=A0ABS5EG50_9PROT|nr:hypothetical protein [Neoroseomonas terrae]MBR0649955.1 hypothetical protein [Neoroseomonas terrae]
MPETACVRPPLSPADHQAEVAPAQIRHAAGQDMQGFHSVIALLDRLEKPAKEG